MTLPILDSVRARQAAREARRQAGADPVEDGLLTLAAFDGFPGRVRGALERYAWLVGPIVPDDLVTTTDRDLQRVRGIGAAAVREIRARVPYAGPETRRIPCPVCRGCGRVSGRTDG